MRKRLTLLSALVAFCLAAMAQDVTVSPKTGNMIPAVNEGYTETGWASGAFALWRHKQLPLTVTVGDYPELSTDGLMASHANNLYPNSAATPNEDTTGESYLVMMAGASQPGYMTISLPRGMKFTRYRIVMRNNVVQAGTLPAGTSASVEFGECTVSTGTWNYTNVAGTYQNMGTTQQQKTTEYVVTRTSTTDGDMGNILYFKLQDSDNNRYHSVAFKSILVEFTSEAPFTVPVQPSAVRTSGVSYVEVPFLTGKQDLGYIESRTSNGSTRNGYHKDQLKDIPASLWLYEQAAIGTDGQLPTTDTGQKTISQVRSGGKGFFRISATDANNTYYVETPDKTHDQFGNNIYLDYRITGATIHYATEVDATEATPAVEGGTYITYTSGSDTYYLQADARSWSTTDKTVWVEENGKLYTVADGTRNYLTVSRTRTLVGYVYYLTTSTTLSEASDFSIAGQQISTTYNGNTSTTFYLTTSTTIVGFTNYLRFQTTSSGDYTYPTYTVVEPQEASEAEEAQTLQPYTLTVYGTDGETPVETITVSGSGSYELTGLNNDAVKLQLSGTGLVRVDVQMEYLNPFISSMQVQMTSEANPDFRATQTFTATDFAVGGGTFDFQIPSDLVGQTVDFTFSNLRSNYADATYPWGSALHRSRYNFVKSDYFNLHNLGATTGDEAISFMGDNNLYSDKANVADHDYSKKIAVDYAGNVEFKYNNAGTYADEIAASAQRHTTLREYLFTLENYANQTTLSGATADGSFQKVTLTPTAGATATTRAFLVITDETRYNIAPTTGVQHRFHAFYDMTINANTTSYTTTATLQPVYDSSYYGSAESGSFYGAVVTTSVGATGQSSIRNAIAAVREACTAASVSPSQLLYIDMGSQLAGVYTSSDGDYDAIKTVFTAPNLLVFLPRNTTHSQDNFAYAEQGSCNLSFRAGANIIITDKQPFFSPYDISMGATNYAQYDRQVTLSKYGKNKYGTFILPFVLDNIRNGVFREADGSEFTILKMNTDNAISDAGDVNKTVPTGYFSPITATQTAANEPYAFQLQSDFSADDDITFRLRQHGSNIVRTSASQPAPLAFTSSDTSTGTLSDGGSVVFTMAGTFAGRELDKTTSPIFYFAREGFWNSRSLASRYTTAKVLPFRAYYTYEGTAGAKLAQFDVAVGENPTATAIGEVAADNDGITTGKGVITIISSRGGRYSIVSAAAQTIASLSLSPGQRRDVRVPAGLYLVNAKKVAVK